MKTGKEVTTAHDGLDDTNHDKYKNNDTCSSSSLQQLTKKRKRSGKGNPHYIVTSNTMLSSIRQSNLLFDLYVTLPIITTAAASGGTTTSTGQQKQHSGSTITGGSNGTVRTNLFMTQKLIERLYGLGYKGCSFVHTCYGRPKIELDSIEQLQMEKITSLSLQQITKQSRFQDTNFNDKKTKIFSILKRLQIVVENSSDVYMYYCGNCNQSTIIDSTLLKKRNLNKVGDSQFSNKSDDVEGAIMTSDRPTSTRDIIATVHSILDGYDLVSLCPRNDSTFQASCTSPVVDIITLDYYSNGNVGLPYKIRTLDIENALIHDIIFEIPYGPSIIQRQCRKTFIKVLHQFQNACLNVKKRNNSNGSNDSGGNCRRNKDVLPKLLVTSSGTRFRNDDKYNDIGPIMLRSSKDVTNLLHTVLHFQNMAKKKNSKQSFDTNFHYGNSIVQYFFERKQLKKQKQQTIKSLVSTCTSNSSLSIGASLQSQMVVTKIVSVVASRNLPTIRGDSDDAMDVKNKTNEMNSKNQNGFKKQNNLHSGFSSSRNNKNREFYDDDDSDNSSDSPFQNSQPEIQISDRTYEDNTLDHDYENDDDEDEVVQMKQHHQEKAEKNENVSHSMAVEARETNPKGRNHNNNYLGVTSHDEEDDFVVEDGFISF